MDGGRERDREREGEKDRGRAIDLDNKSLGYLCTEKWKPGC